MASFRVGVDIGGTFTDVVFLGDDGRVLVRKVASTPGDYSQAVLEGVRVGMDELRLDPGDVYQVSHGFTVATNAILEYRGVKTALITTAGFRDVLELRRNRVPRLYALRYEKPADLVERRLRFEVRERMTFQGEVLVPLDTEDVERALERLKQEEVASVAVCLLHSYANADHERRIAQAIRERLPDVTLSVSSELLPEMREYERTSTTVINAYVRPVVERYLGHLSRELKSMGVQVPLMVMQSNGGMSSVKAASERPCFCVESGPAAGVIGAQLLGKRLGVNDLLALDMGGTTAKASTIESGELLKAPEYEVGGGMNVGHRLLKGTGYILRVPAIDIAEVGAGGGSIAWVDKGGSLQVGPHSAGADPGPACYDMGGVNATVTDANVVLGYLNSEYLLGGSFPIQRRLSEEAVQRDVAGPLGMSLTDAAYGIHLLSNSNMGRALRAVSSERGRDPRRFTLVAFGGGGPVHAAVLASMLDIKRVIVPPFPGVFSAFGLLFSDVEQHLVRTFFRRLDAADPAELQRVLDALIQEGRGFLREEGYDDARQAFELQADMRYSGQSSELTVSMPDGRMSPARLTELGENFEAEHERTYGYRSPETLQLVNLRVIARGLSPHRGLPDRIQTPGEASDAAPSQRRAYFGQAHGWLDTPVVARADLRGRPQHGPLLIEEYDSTTVVPPDWRVSLGEWQELVLEHEA